MKCKLKITILFLVFLNLNSLIQSGAHAKNFKDKNWFSLLDESSELVGTGNLTFFGIKLYRASLISTSNFDHEYPFKINFALKIKYSKNFSKEKIANISRKEILKLNISKKEDLELWHEWMLVEFPDISSGDILTGIFSPNFGLKLFHNNQLTATNNDIEFAKAFFSIWLSKNTSEPLLREKLLGINN